jgi:hypothetical protein
MQNGRAMSMIVAISREISTYLSLILSFFLE